MGTIYKFNAWDAKMLVMIENAVVLTPGKAGAHLAVKLLDNLIWLPYTGENDANAYDLFLYDIVLVEDEIGVIVYDEGHYLIQVRLKKGDGHKFYELGGKTLIKKGNYFQNSDLVPDIKLSTS